MSERKYLPTWDSIVTHSVPKWFRDAKFGIYTHWGPYSVPAWGENTTWYSYQMYREGDERSNPAYHHHLREYGHPSEHGYTEFLPQFTGEKFDADEWAEIFSGAGAKFAGPCAVHHDGFALWDSKVNERNSVNFGPGRDFVAEQEKAFRAKGMKFAATFHHAFNWFWFPVWDKEMDCGKPENQGPGKFYPKYHDESALPDREYHEWWLGQTKEVIDQFAPDLIWFDFGVFMLMQKYRQEFMSYYYSKEAEWDKEVIVTFKEIAVGGQLGEQSIQYGFAPGTGVMDYEKGKLSHLTDNMWITDTTIDSRSGWGYVRESGYKSPERLIHNLVDRVSKNGSLLLNVGPRPDGSIPQEAQYCLREMGKWLEINGDAIFETTPWIYSDARMAGSHDNAAAGDKGGHFNEANELRLTSEDFRFTTKGDSVYAICLGIPGDRVQIPYMNLHNDEVKQITMVGSEAGPLNWQLFTGKKEGLYIDLKERPKSQIACAFKIDLNP